MKFMVLTVNYQTRESANIGTARDEKPSGYKSTELGLIPEDWEIKSIQEIAEVKGGKRLPAGEQLSKIRTPYPYIRIVDMYYGGIRLNSLMYLSEEVYRRIKNYRISHKDIFISVAGSLGIVGKIPKEIDNANLTENADKISNIQCDRDFLLHNLMSQRIQNKIDEEKTVGAQPKLALNRIKSFKIGIPSSLEEQQTIAVALSDIDSLISTLDQLIAKKRNIKLAAMQQLLTGKQRLPGFSEDRKLRTLGEIVEIKKGSLITEKEAISGNIPVIAGGKNPSYFHNQSNRSGKTITISGSGANAGYVSIFFTPIFASDCSTISEGKNFVIEYIYYQLILNQNKIYKMQTGGAQPHVHPSDLTPLEISIPSYEEQKAVANILSDMDTELSTLEQQLAKARNLKQGMMQELLTGRIRLK